MKTFLLVVTLVFIASIMGCSYLFPNQSKALTEEAQLEESKKENTLLGEQNKALKQLADNTKEVADAVKGLTALAANHGLCGPR